MVFLWILKNPYENMFLLLLEYFDERKFLNFIETRMIPVFILSFAKSQIPSSEIFSYL
jgi:hypothetical protein